MTEKRFRYDNGVWDNNVEDMADALLTEKECVDLLNKQHEENEQLKQKNTDLVNISIRYQDKIGLLENENEQLKENYNSLSHNNGLLYDECSNKINALKKENEQLKSDLKLALPVLLAIDFKISINECEAINRLCNAINDDFITGKDCDVE